MRRVAWVVITALLLAVPGSTSQAATWERSVNLPTAGGVPSDPAIAFDRQGAAVAAWRSTPVGARRTDVISTASRLPGRRWVRGPRLRPPGVPDVIRTPFGRLRLSRFRTETACRPEVFDVRPTVRGPVLMPRKVPPCRVSGEDWLTAESRGGRARARVVRRGDAFKQLVVQRGSRGSPLGPERIVATATASDPFFDVEELLVNVRGDVLVIWDGSSGARARVLRRTGALDAPQPVPEPTIDELDRSEALFGPRGEIVLLYVGYSGDPEIFIPITYLVQIAVRGAGQRGIGPLRTLVEARNGSAEGDAAMSLDGTAAVVWSHDGGRVSTAVLGRRGLLDERNYRASPTARPKVTVGEDGSFLATWEGRDDSSLLSSLLAPGATRFGQGEMVLSSTISPSDWSVAFDPLGRRFVIVAPERARPKARTVLAVRERRR